MRTMWQIFKRGMCLAMWTYNSQVLQEGIGSASVSAMRFCLGNEEAGAQWLKIGKSKTTTNLTRLQSSLASAWTLQQRKKPPWWLAVLLSWCSLPRLFSCLCPVMRKRAPIRRWPMLRKPSKTNSPLPSSRQRQKRERLVCASLPRDMTPRRHRLPLLISPARVTLAKPWISAPHSH